MYEFAESYETFLNLFFHEYTQIFRFLPLFNRFSSPSDSMTPDWEGMLGAYNVVAAAELNSRQIVGLYQDSQPKLSQTKNTHYSECRLQVVLTKPAFWKCWHLQRCWGEQFNYGLIIQYNLSSDKIIKPKKFVTHITVILFYDSMLFMTQHSETLNILVNISLLLVNDRTYYFMS